MSLKRKAEDKKKPEPKKHKNETEPVALPLPALPTDRKQLRILSIDGGGIRGLIPAYFLLKIEEATKKKISELFHMIVGTSTGGILSIGLSMPNPQTAEELYQIYLKKGTEIFPQSRFPIFSELEQFFQDRYDSSHLEKLLRETCKETSLKEVEDVELMVTSFDINLGKPHFFKSWDARKEPGKCNFKLSDIARATSAAPTYFHPATIYNEEKEKFTLIDGGVFANNPSMCALASAMAHFKNISQEDIFVLSLGTGFSKSQPLSGRIGGEINWVVPLINILMDGAVETTKYQMEKIFKDNDNYVRFDMELNGDYPLDGVSAKQVEHLRGAAENLLSDPKEKEKFDAVINKLNVPRTPRKELGFVIDET